VPVLPDPSTTKTHAAQKFDPRYVQISRAEFSAIIGRSTSELDKLRKRDPRCPKGHKNGGGPRANVLFVLSECYEYSQLLIDDAKANRYA